MTRSSAQVLVALAALLAVALSAASCTRDNGVPGDLIAHLHRRGIAIEPTQVHAPAAERGGFVVFRHDPRVAAAIVAAFSLKPVAADDRHWQMTAGGIGSPVAAKAIWGVSGRPPQFTLEDGGQFEYVYLVVTPDDDVYLFAEYAYG